MPVKEWKEVWEDLRRELTRLMAEGKPIETLCQKRPNRVIAVGDDFVVVRAAAPERETKCRCVEEWQIRKAWQALVERGELKGLIPELKERRVGAITYAILALLPYVEGGCEGRHVVLRLRDP